MNRMVHQKVCMWIICDLVFLTVGPSLKLSTLLNGDSLGVINLSTLSEDFSYYEVQTQQGVYVRSCSH